MRILVQAVLVTLCLYLSTALAGFNCVPTQNYKGIFYPIAQDGSGCVGGNNGNIFRILRNLSPVRILRVWTGHSDRIIVGMYVYMSDFTFSVIGFIPDKPPDAEIEFDLGEHLVGDITLSPSQGGTRLNYIAFQTNKGKKFSAGVVRTPYYFETNDGFLMGFYGRYEAGYVNQLATYIMPQPVSMTLTNVVYPTLHTYNQGLKPQRYIGNFCNFGSVDQSQEAIFTKSSGESYSWSESTSTEYDLTITVKAELPKIESIGGSAKWSLEETFTYAKEKSTVYEQVMQFPVVVPANSSLMAEFEWYASRIGLPYEGTLEITFDDGRQINKNVSGYYEGAFISGVKGLFKTLSLEESMC